MLLHVRFQREADTCAFNARWPSTRLFFDVKPLSKRRNMLDIFTDTAGRFRCEEVSYTGLRQRAMGKPGVDAGRTGNDWFQVGHELR